MTETPETSTNPNQPLQIYRPHVVELLVPTLWSLLMLLPALLIILAVNAMGLIDGHTLQVGEWLFGGLYLVFVISYFMTNVIFWYMDAWILAPEGLMDIQLISFFNRRVAQLGWNQVQDVRESTEGILSTLFGYGNIVIQSAGKEGIFKMHSIINAKAVSDLIKEWASASQQMPQSPPADINPPTSSSPPPDAFGSFSDIK